MIRKAVIVVLVLVVAAASAAFLICTPQSSQTPAPAAVVTQPARTAPVPRPPRTGTVLRIECDIPDEVGPVPMTYPGRIDWPGHSERFPFTLSKDTLAVALDRQATAGFGELKWDPWAAWRSQHETHGFASLPRSRFAFIEEPCLSSHR